MVFTSSNPTIQIMSLFLLFPLNTFHLNNYIHLISARTLQPNAYVEHVLDSIEYWICAKSAMYLDNKIIPYLDVPINVAPYC